MPTKSGDMTKRELAKKNADELCKLANKVARLRRIIDSRPAINAGLPETYIEWSQSIYQLEFAKAYGNTQ